MRLLPETRQLPWSYHKAWTPGRRYEEYRCIDGFKEPTTQTQLRSFIGLCNVYRRFVPNFARVTSCLNRML